MVDTAQTYFDLANKVCHENVTILRKTAEDYTYQAGELAVWIAYAFVEYCNYGWIGLLNFYNSSDLYNRVDGIWELYSEEIIRALQILPVTIVAVYSFIIICRFMSVSVSSAVRDLRVSLVDKDTQISKLKETVIELHRKNILSAQQAVKEANVLSGRNKKLTQMLKTLRDSIAPAQSKLANLQKTMIEDREQLEQTVADALQERDYALAEAERLRSLRPRAQDSNVRVILDKVKVICNNQGQRAAAKLSELRTLVDLDDFSDSEDEPRSEYDPDYKLYS